MKRIIVGLLIGLCAMQGVMAQAPKWMEKAKQAVFSVVAYDAEDKILNTGNGFFVSADGEALSDYSLFKGAQRAVVLTSAGKQLPVEAIMGADELYDVIRFRVNTAGKKVEALSVAATPPSVGSEIYLLPYSTRKDRSFTKGTVKQADDVADNFLYFTLNMPLQDKMVSCPVVTAEGKVFGMAQQSSGEENAQLSYAVDVRFVRQQQITALSYNDGALRNIGIKKALPETEEQALVFLYMAAPQVSAEVYSSLLNDFISQYPGSADGYLRRAAHLLSHAVNEKDFQAVEQDMDKALDVCKKADDVHYNRAKMVYSYLIAASGEAYKEWSYDWALQEIEKAIAINSLPVYTQLAGDIRFAKQDYTGALACYEQVNKTNLKSASTYFSVVRSKEMLQASQEEILALMDSCVAQLPQPFTEQAAPYLLERAQRRVNAGNARKAVVDYDAYFDAMSGKVNDVFYYYREQAALKAKQYQRALDDLAKAIELNPKELTYRAELAVVNIRVGRNEEAIKVLDAALAVDATYAEAYRLKGLAYVQLKQKNEACSCFAKAKELGDPNVEELIQKHCK